MAHGGLAKLAEELGELQQVVGKLLAHPNGDHPDGGPSLLDRLADEAADVMAAIAFVFDKFPSTQDRAMARAEQKYERFQEWDKAS